MSSSLNMYTNPYL